MQEIKRYIDQLLSDFDSLNVDMKKSKDTSKVNGNSSNSFTIIPKVVSISQISGIKSCELPDEKLINDEFASKLVKSMTGVLKALNIVPDFPLNIPDITKYGLFRDYWDVEFKITNKEHHIDFCHYHPDNCPYTDYCKICNDLNDED